ncbi:MAG: hypothetical protein MJ252_15855 [archaeon]|nr:hypothetical protein [archaeon]
MEGDDLEQMLQGLLKKFMQAEEKKLENSKKYKEWIKQITADDFHLVDNLMKCVMNDKTEPKLKEGIFKIFRKLTMISECKDKIKAELKKSKDFQKAIVDYITSKERDDLQEDPFVLLFENYNASEFKEYFNEKFVGSLFAGLVILKSEEELIFGLIMFLVDMGTSSKKEEQELFLTCHKNADVKEFMFFNESLLSLITKYSKEKNKEMFKKVITCITYIMDNEDKEILYKNDIETFYLSIQEELQLFNDMAFKVGYMQFLLRIVRLSLFKEMKLDTSSLKDFLEDDNMPGELKGIAMRILDTIK